MHQTQLLCVPCLHERPLAPPPRLSSSGMLNGAKGVANDACLYGEDTVIRLLNESIQGDTGAKVRTGLRMQS